MVDGFLKYIQDWEDSVNQRERESSVNEKDSVSKPPKKSKGKSRAKQDNKYSQAEKQRMLLSTQTREGLRITGKCK